MTIFGSLATLFGMIAQVLALLVTVLNLHQGNLPEAQIWATILVAFSIDQAVRYGKD